MSNNPHGNAKQKKSKITLDRILSIKRSIMESLNLSKHDKSMPQMQGNHTVPKDQGNMIYLKCPQNGRTISNIPQTPIQNSKNSKNVIFYRTENSPTSCVQGSSQQRPQTWPHNDYFSKVLNEQHLAKTTNNKPSNAVKGECFDQYCRHTQEEVRVTKTSPAVCSVRNQEIQTDAPEMVDANEDIIKYLNQFNDKVAFRMYAPTRLRKLNGFNPFNYETDYNCQNDFSSYYGYQSNRRVPRLPQEWLPVSQQAQTGFHFTHWPQYDHLPLAFFEHQRQNGFGMGDEPRRNNGFGMSSRFQRQNGFDMSNEPQRQNGFGNDAHRQSGFDMSNETQRQNGVGNDAHRQSGFDMSNETQRQNGVGNDAHRQSGFDMSNQLQRQNGFDNEPQRHNWFGMSNQHQRHNGFGNEPQRKNGFGNEPQRKNGFGNEPQRQGSYGMSNAPQRQGSYGMSNAHQRQGSYGMSNAPQRHRENSKYIQATSSQVSSNVQTTPRFATRASSADSGSILSSETDSDFIFYPCSSLTHTFQRVTLLDSRTTSFLSPPLDLPENVSTNFSWRSDFCGSSLDEVTLQFFLDDDALSDDVFVDDCELTYSLTPNHDPQGGYQHEPEADPAEGHGLIYSRSYQNDLDWENELGNRESYSDNCYAYRYTDIDEVLNPDKKSQSELEHDDIDELNKNTVCSETNQTEYIPLLSDPDVQYSYEDPYLSPSHELCNVFDSLRRNSTQTKARKMWRQRRAKSKKNTIDDPNYDNKGEHRKSECQPTIFTFDPVNVHKPTNTKPPPKPLRGILKNKDKTSRLCQPEYRSNELVDPHKATVVPVKEADVNLECYSQPHHCQASVQKHANYPVPIPSYNEVVEDCIESVLHKFPVDTHNLRPNSVASDAITFNEQTDNNPKFDYNEDPVRTSNKAFSESEQTPSPNSNDNERFHLIVSSGSDGTKQIMAVRKNSLENYEWVQSLRRRKGRLARKANRKQDGDKSKTEHRPGQYHSSTTSASSI